MKYLHLILIFTLFVACEKSKDLVGEVLDIEKETLPSIKVTQQELQWTTQNLVDFYKNQDNNTLWNSRDKRNELLEALMLARENGLNPESYPITELFNFNLSYNQLGAEKRRSEEHTSELQSRENLVCRLL